MIRLSFKARISLACIFLFLVSASRLSAQLPSGFSSNTVQTGYTAPMGLVFTSTGSSMFVWDKMGHVYVSKWNGTSYVKQAAAVLDISDEVGDWRDNGLLSFCLDPNFNVNGLVYVYYVVDRHHLLYAGTPQYNAATNDYFSATIGRVTRYHLNMGTTVTADYTSRKILIGESKTTGIPLLWESHMGGTLVFGRDGTMLLAVGDGGSAIIRDTGNAADTYYAQALQDGIIRSQENVGSYRSQMVNSLSGKLLRFDPATGDGIASNPFYDAANPRAPKSRVWAMGFRNPFRMSLQANTGSTNPADGNPGVFIIGNVGSNVWEEIEIVNTKGLNCGWPIYEGETPSTYWPFSTSTTINRDEGKRFKDLCLQPTSFTVDPVAANRRFTHNRPAITWKHLVDETRVPWFNSTIATDPLVGAAGSPTTGEVFQGNCVIGGLYYTGTAFGAAYQNTYFFADYGTGFIKTAKLNTAQPWITNVSNFAPANFSSGLVDMKQSPMDNSIYYMVIGTGLMRISMGGNLPPVAQLSANKTFGPSPLTIAFSSAGSVDPEGATLTYLWNFGDGTTSTLANPTHTFTQAVANSFSVTLTVTDPGSLTSSKSITISINNTPPVAKITNPVDNSLYSVQSATQVKLAATVTDNETTVGMKYAWEVNLHHNNHEHDEPVITETSPTVQISPIGCDGDSYHFLIKLTVTDAGGLTSTDSVNIYPDCSTANLAVTSLTAAPQSNSVQLSWINPTGTFDEILVAAQPTKGFLTNPEGVNYVADSNFAGAGTTFEQGKVVFRGYGQGLIVTGLNSSTKYYFRVFTRIGDSWTGGVETSATTSGAASPNLAVVGVASTATVNLSTEGMADWAHWPGYDHKIAGGGKISNYTVVQGSLAVANYSNDPRTCTWTDGTPNAGGSARNGTFIPGTGNGFQLTAPADQTTRTLKVYVGGYVSGGTFTAQLSDGSSPDYVNSSFSGAGQYDAVYTVTYKAASAAKLLTVKWVQSSGTGNVTLQAATLVVSTVNVTGVALNPTSAVLTINGTKQLTATVTPANASNANVTWSSSNNAVATVDAKGLVTAIAEGTAIITVTTGDGNKIATCNITVSNGSLAGSGLSSGATVNLSAEGTFDWAHWPGYDHKATGGSKISNYVVVQGSRPVLDYSNDPRTCAWNDGIPAASGSGRTGIFIPGIGNGFQLTVPADLATRTLKVYVGGYISGGTLTAQLSDNSAPIYVDSAFSGTGQYNAVYTITYKAASAGKLLTVKWVQSSGTGNVTLQAATLTQAGTLVNVTEIAVNPTSAFPLINSTQQLTATISPVNASNKNVTWNSSNEAVATVSGNGVVTAISAGNAIITVTTQDGNKTATSNITVTTGGLLSSSGVSSSVAINLSAEGAADWAHWPGYDHKSTGGGKISDYVVVQGSSAVLNYLNDPRTCSWDNGTPVANGSNRSGIFIAGIGNGFQLTAPADLTTRTLKVYVGGYASGGTLTATLSDGSSATYVNSSFSGTSQYNAVYTLTYKAASAGKVCTVKWVQSSGTGNVTLQGATLVESPDTMLITFNK